MIDRNSFITLPDYTSLSRKAAEDIFSKISLSLSQHSPFVLGMATGSTPLGLYKELISLFKEHPLDLSRFYTVNLDEYVGLSPEDPQSYYSYMKEHFWEPISSMYRNFDYTKQGLIPHGQADNLEDECQRYEAQIQQLGGINLQILGIGTNGHIGFNEPGSSPDSRTRPIDLAQTTIQDNSVHFGGDQSKVPKKAITMGIATILEAKEIVVLASGESKKEIVRKLVESAEPTKDIPATYLSRHSHVTFYLDLASNPA